MPKTLPVEAVEAAAIRFVSRGDGIHKVPKGNPLYGLYDEVYVAIYIEEPTRIYLHLQNNGKTTRQFAYDLKLVKEECGG